MDKDGDGHLSNIEFIVRLGLLEQGRGRAKGVRISIDDGYGFVYKTKFVGRCGSWGRSGSVQVHGDVSKAEFVVSKRLLTQPYFAGGGGGGGVRADFNFRELPRYLSNTYQMWPLLLKFIYWGTRFWKNFASRVSHVAMATTFSTPSLLKF